MFSHTRMLMQTNLCAQRLIESMDAAGVDVLVYPTWANVARLVGDYSSPDGAHCAAACYV